MGLSNSKRVSTAGELVGRFGSPAVRYVYHTYLQSSKRRDVTFDISDETFERLIFSACHYCGKPPYNETKRTSGTNITYTGIDRVDNSKPYTEHNTVPCCKLCNSMKSNLSEVEFLLHIERLVVWQLGRIL